MTNDQAFGLVDTASLRAQGFHVGEVPGACFCCKFDDLVETVARLTKSERPNIVIVEPVGSCTDLVATVVEPLRHFHGDLYDIAPMIVLVKPEHGLRILRDQSGFSPKAEYIFLKQIEEADVAVINKIDKLSEDDRSELLRLVAERFPTKSIHAMSARDGTGFAELIRMLESTTTERDHSLEVDYDVYAEGEAELGWLNCAATFSSTSQRKFAMDRLLTDLVGRIATALRSSQDEPAHVKVLAQSGTDFAVANLVDSESTCELSVASEVDVSVAEVLINARVAGDPEQLADTARRALLATADAFGVEAQLGETQHFRPSRPVPTHRITR